MTTEDESKANVRKEIEDRKLAQALHVYQPCAIHIAFGHGISANSVRQNTSIMNSLER